MKCKITIELDIPDGTIYTKDCGKFFTEKIIKGYCYFASLIFQRDLKDDKSVLFNRSIINTLTVVDSTSIEDDTKIL